MTVRCCLCRLADDNVHGYLESTDLPGSGYRCSDHDACAQRVRDIVSAHVQFSQI